LRFGLRATAMPRPLGHASGPRGRSFPRPVTPSHDVEADAAPGPNQPMITRHWPSADTLSTGRVVADRWTKHSLGCAAAKPGRYGQ
jgi:hypothetical protein